MGENIRFKKFSTESGLSQCIITSIMQDSKGFIWIGTHSGLNRYDGYNFKIYKSDLSNPHSIQDNYVFKIYENKKGNLFIGSYNSIFMEYCYEQDVFKKIELPDCDSKSYISAITEDENSDIWIGTSTSGMYRLDKDRNFVRQYKSDNCEDDNSINCNNISSLYFDKNSGRLYIGTLTGGLNILDYNEQNFLRIEADTKSKFSKSGNGITFIFRDSRSDLLIGSNFGFYKLDENNLRYLEYCKDVYKNKSISDFEVSHICEDFQGNLWISVREKGLICLNYKQNRIEHFEYQEKNETGLFCNSIKCLFRDKSNVIWIGTTGDGLGMIDRQQNNFNQIKNPEYILTSENKNINVIRSIFKDSNSEYWFGTFYNGLYNCKEDKENKYCFSNLKEIGNNKVASIFEDSAKNLWITYQKFGICCYSLSEKQFTFRPLNLYKDEDHKNIIYSYCKCIENPDLVWLGSSIIGLLKFHIPTKKITDTQFIPDELRNITIYSLYLESDRVLWIGSSGSGLYKYFTEESYFINFKHNPENENSLSNNSVNCICKDSLNRLWIGTENGLNKLSADGKSFERYSKLNGLKDNTILGMLTDENDNIWLSTYSGISKLSLKENAFKNYLDCDGLNNKEYNKGAFYKSEDGKLYFGGIDGITFFDPKEIKDNPYIPDVVITDFQLFNESVKPSPDNPFLKKSITHTEEIVLSYKESVFSFEFAALIYNNPEKNQYAYMMDGFDKDWVYCGTRRNATYTNLDPGDYIFKVKASNNDEIWNEDGTSIRIKITPPYWKTWWFKGLGMLSLIGATGLTYRQRLYKLEKEKQTQEKYSKKLLYSQETERKRIANELHDSIAHDILILKNNVVIAMNNTKEEDTKNALNEISEQSSSTLNDVRNISYNLHPHQIEALGITKAIKSMIDKASKSTHIKFILEEDIIDNIFSEENEVYIYRIIQEAVSNIIKHSSADEAMLRISRTDKSVVIIISDNGRGFSAIENANKNSLGLSGISERIKILNGSFKIETAEGKGTILKIDLPVIR